MYSIVKPFLIAVAIIFFLLLVIGIVRFEKPTYGCFGSRSFRFGERVRIVDVGSFKIYAFPLIFDCPEEDRYDPNEIYPCGKPYYCHKDDTDEKL